jgi:FkbM family methyltransferase
MVIFKRTSHDQEKFFDEVFERIVDSKAATSRDFKPDFSADTNPDWSLAHIVNKISHDDSYLEFLKIAGYETDLLDVGANYGYSFSTFHGFGFRGNYLAVEPLIQHEPSLKALSCEFDSFDYEIAGLSDSNGELRICIPCFKESARSALSFFEMPRESIPLLLRNLLPADYSRFKLKDLNFVWQSVHLRRMDDLLKSKSFLPGAIKIDTEGHEFEVLLGGERTISEIKPALLIEGANRKIPVREFLRRHDYRFVKLDENEKIKVVDLDTFLDEENGIFIHSSSL